MNHVIDRNRLFCLFMILIAVAASAPASAAKMRVTDAGEEITPMPQMPGIDAAMQAAIDAHEVAGAVTVVVTKDKILHLQAKGLADIAAGKPMQPDSRFWIASMTKPITAVAVLMLQDEGKLNMADPVAKYITAFADLKTPSGKPAAVTSAYLTRLWWEGNWLCLALFSPSVQCDISLIIPCNNSAYTHLTFLQIGFVLQNLVQNDRRLLSINHGFHG